MRKIPASEQPTQLNVRETTDYQGHLRKKPRRRPLSVTWLGALGIVLVLCAMGGFIAAYGARSVYLSLGSDDNVIYEVVERQQPITVASTTGSAVSTAPLSSVFTDEVQFWAPLIAEWSVAWEIDPNLIATVIQIESCGDPTISSSAGAQGLFQVMPFHFDPGEDMLDIQNNASRGLAYLNGGLDRSQGHAGLALAGYNGGHSVIDKGYASWAAETRRYYYWGAGIYADATAGLQTSPRVQEWLNAGGQGLCDRARISEQDYQINIIEDGNS